MQPSDKDRARLRHMLDAATEALQSAAGRKPSDLDADRQLEHTLTRCLEIVGEAANNVSAEFRAATPVIAWTPLIKMRHRLIHVYFNINRKMLWRTVGDELPPLISTLHELLADEAAAEDAPAT